MSYGPFHSSQKPWASRQSTVFVGSGKLGQFRVHFLKPMCKQIECFCESQIPNGKTSACAVLAKWINIWLVPEVCEHTHTFLGIWNSKTTMANLQYNVSCACPRLCRDETSRFRLVSCLLATHRQVLMRQSFRWSCYPGGNRSRVPYLPVMPNYFVFGIPFACFVEVLKSTQNPTIDTFFARKVVYYPLCFVKHFKCPPLVPPSICDSNIQFL